MHRSFSCNRLHPGPSPPTFSVDLFITLQSPGAISIHYPSVLQCVCVRVRVWWGGVGWACACYHQCVGVRAGVRAQLASQCTFIFSLPPKSTTNSFPGLGLGTATHGGRPDSRFTERADVIGGNEDNHLRYMRQTHGAKHHRR